MSWDDGKDDGNYLLGFMVEGYPELRGNYRLGLLE